jgi:hypothetical protein
MQHGRGRVRSSVIRILFVKLRVSKSGYKSIDSKEWLSHIDLYTHGPLQRGGPTTNSNCASKSEEV